MSYEITDEGAIALMNAVVIRAVEDYRKALYGYNTAKHKNKKLTCRNVIGECELFFRKNLDAFCELDGEELIGRIHAQVRDELKRKGIIMEVPKL